MNDVETEDDVKKLVDSFYEKVLKDDVISHHFQTLDLARHLPNLYNFWTSILLGAPVYVGSPFISHLHLNLANDDFIRWLELFRKTVDENFVGEKADEAKQRADNIAGMFQYKLGLLQ